MRVQTPIQARKVPARKASGLPGLLSFGDSNLWPQNLSDVISESPTAAACITVRADFIEGNGFNDKRFWKLKVHRSGLTMDSLLSATAMNVSKFETIVIHVGYNGLGQIASLRPVPFEMVRLGEPDDFNIITHAAICPYLDSDYFKSKKHQHKLLPLFNPDPEVVFDQIEAAGGIEQYEGQLLYMPVGRESFGYYPAPSYRAAIDDIRTESGLCRYDFNTVASGFNVSGIVGCLNPASVAKPTGQNPDVASMKDQISQLMGADNAGDVMVVEFDSKDELEAFKFVPTTGAELADRYESTAKRVEYRIARAMGVPNELAGIQREGGMIFGDDELLMASRMLQKKVNPFQRKIQEQIERIFQYWKNPADLPQNNDFTIENQDYFKQGQVAQPGA